MNHTPLDIVFLGLSITSSWGNGHATTYRGLVHALHKRGHRVLFLERDVQWYAAHRDLPDPPYGRTVLYRSLDELRGHFTQAVKHADLVVVGSYVPDGIEVGDWVQRTATGVTAFYDIDTPVTLRQLESGGAPYLAAEQISRYDLYLSFTGGPTLARIERDYGAPLARPLYCSADPAGYFEEPTRHRWDLGYMGTYSEDRQPALHALLIEPASLWPDGRFVVAGPMYPEEIAWPANVQRIPHLAPPNHRVFYNSQRFTLNVTRRDMALAGFSPSVRLFEAAACAAPVITDEWEGIDHFFVPGEEILIARSTQDTLRYLRELPEEERRTIGRRARDRVLAEHTPAHRAAELEAYARRARAGHVMH